MVERTPGRNLRLVEAMSKQKVDGVWGRKLQGAKKPHGALRSPKTLPSSGRKEQSMRFILISAVLTSVAMFSSCSPSGGSSSSSMDNPYLGLSPPGATPKPFAPGMVTTSNYEYGGVFSPDLKEFYFIRNNPDNDKHEVVVLQNQGGKWQESEVFPRKGTHLFSPDGRVMHLGKRFMERGDGGWSELQRLPEPFDDLPIMRLSSSSNGTYYFDEFKRDFTGSIWFSRKINGQYEEPKLVGETINTGKSFHPFIAPDESYIIFDSKREGGFGDSDLYISYRTRDGSWSEAINLGDKINTEAWEAAANVTSDGKYMLFNRNMGSSDYENVDIFWVSASFIDELRVD